MPVGEQHHLAGDLLVRGGVVQRQDRDPVAVDWSGSDAPGCGSSGGRAAGPDSHAERSINRMRRQPREDEHRFGRDQRNPVVERHDDAVIVRRSPGHNEQLARELHPPSTGVRRREGDVNMR